MPRIEENITPQ